jgi:hypothetical protein
MRRPLPSSTAHKRCLAVCLVGASGRSLLPLFLPLIPSHLYCLLDMDSNEEMIQQIVDDKAASNDNVQEQLEGIA